MPGFVDRDPWLEPFREAIAVRRDRFDDWVSALETTGGLLGKISSGHREMGFQFESDGTVVYREWAPAAHALTLIGDFNGWERREHPLQRCEGGIWEIRLPSGILNDGDRVKVHVISQDPPRDRIPAWIRGVAPAPDGDVVGLVRRPGPTVARLPTPRRECPRVYEAHVGVSTEEGSIGTWERFAREHLDRICDLGYNTIQLMAVQEHPYFASFGYHVSSFFAPSHRFGTADDLKFLIAEAHRRGLAVWMDLVHSHAVSNVREGLNRFDGSGGQYFHDGPRGYHGVWDSRLFHYGHPEVQRFLLSNIRYWIEEFGFDGFRFDGVTSMIYRDHGIGRTFGEYPTYFGDLVDEDAVLYLQAANRLAHALSPEVQTVAEDVSGMPGMARPVVEGGLGFDFRLAMGVPDAWVRWVRHRRDEEWDVGEIWSELTRRRLDESHVGYAESHDQSIVGDQALAFRLMGAEMYDGMEVGRQSVRIDRGIALHKLIRLLTFFLSGEAWLNFMGNEFGHPEWLDLPREGNGWSMHYARRQWSLAEDPSLRYRGLLEFDRALMRLDQDHDVLGTGPPHLLLADRERQILVAARGTVTMAVNLSPESSVVGFDIPIATPSDHALVLNTDDALYGGHDRAGQSEGFPWWSDQSEAPRIRIYLPNRTGLVFVPKSPH